MPQPNLVPVSAASSRSAHSSSFSGGASSATGFWLRVKFTGMRYPLGDWLRAILRLLQPSSFLLNALFKQGLMAQKLTYRLLLKRALSPHQI